MYVGINNIFDLIKRQYFPRQQLTTEDALQKVVGALNQMCTSSAACEISRNNFFQYFLMLTYSSTDLSLCLWFNSFQELIKSRVILLSSDYSRTINCIC